MSVRTFAAVAATTALAASTVLVGTGAAEAKPASLKSTYTCEASVLGDQDVAVTTKIDLPAKVKKGTKVTDRVVKMTVVLPETLVSPLRDILGVSELSGTATEIKYSVGAAKIPLKNVKLAKTAVPDSGPMTLRAKGIAQGFSLKKPGTYTVKIPQGFFFTAIDQDGNVIAGSGFPCSLADGAPAKLGSIKVTK